DAQTIIPAAGLSSGTSEGIALDVARGKLYFTVSESHEIRSANLDGTGVTTLLNVGSLPGDIDFDAASGQLYWTDGYQTVGTGVRRTSAAAPGVIETLIDAGSIANIGGSIDYDSVDQLLY